jgi:peptidoglycan/xylan/chitin deacetylase (PgdA/CDA1 family)
MRPLVLHYHGLGDVPRRLDPHELMLSSAAFRSQVGLLKKRGYRFVAQQELARILATGKPADDVCSITFDDGTSDNASLLPPVLEALGVPATIFACPGLLGKPYPFTEPEAKVRLMNREELLRTAGHDLIEIGSHTREHTVLEHASAEQAFEEMSASRAALEDLLGCLVLSFAYPNCLYSTACPDAARRAGYTSAVTCGRRGGLDPYELRRESPSPKDGRLRFELKARGAFDDIWDLPPIRLARAVTRPLRRSRPG